MAIWGPNNSKAVSPLNEARGFRLATVSGLQAMPAIEAAYLPRLIGLLGCAAICVVISIPWNGRRFRLVFFHMMIRYGIQWDNFAGLRQPGQVGCGYKDGNLRERLRLRHFRRQALRC